MNKNFSPRPEDFRFAWANAYHLSILKVAELQHHSDIQLKLSLELLESGTERTEYFRTSLHSTGTVIINLLKKAGQDSEARIKDATSNLTRLAESLYYKEIQLREDTLQMKHQLQEDLINFKRAKIKFYGQPLWKRILQSLTGRE